MSRKLLAVLLAGLFVASAASTAFAHCGGWLPSVGDRHVCCRGGEMASDSRATSCCAMAEQSDDTGPTEARVGTPPLKIVRHATPAVLAAVPGWPALVVRASERGRAPSLVPLYLRQLSLLI